MIELTVRSKKSRNQQKNVISPFNTFFIRIFPKNKKKHCHSWSLYKLAANNNFDLKYQLPEHIPTVFHNLSGYDAHLFIKQSRKKI